MAQTTAASEYTFGFVSAVQAPPASSGRHCGEASHSHVLALSKQLSSDLEHSNVGYTVHGMFGIFADGGAINRNADGSEKTVRGRIVKPNYLNYSHFKTRFIFDHTCHTFKRASHGTQRQLSPGVCEIGFNAGLSAMLLLEATPPNVRITSFDVNAFIWTTAASKLVSRAYGSRFEVVWGDSRLTLPKHKAKRGSSFSCGLTFVDGLKDPSGKRQHLRDLRQVSPAGAWIFIDDVHWGTVPCASTGTTAEGAIHCVVGPAPAESDMENRTMPWRNEGAMLAYAEGAIKMLECRWPPALNERRDADGWRQNYKHEGLCLATVVA